VIEETVKFCVVNVENTGERKFCDTIDDILEYASKTLFVVDVNEETVLNIVFEKEELTIAIDRLIDESVRDIVVDKLETPGPHAINGNTSAYIPSIVDISKSSVVESLKSVFIGP